LPSRKHPDRKRISAPERERPARPPHRRTGAQIDSEALERRERGESFSAIARGLELRRTKDAIAAFHRALRSKPDAERAAATQGELMRLDRLEVRIRARDAEDPEKRDRRLAALDILRNQL
jgi:hypothetical protein